MNDANLPSLEELLQPTRRAKSERGGKYGEALLQLCLEYRRTFGNAAIRRAVQQMGGNSGSGQTVSNMLSRLTRDRIIHAVNGPNGTVEYWHPLAGDMPVNADAVRPVKHAKNFANPASSPVHEESLAKAQDAANLATDDEVHEFVRRHFADAWFDPDKAAKVALEAGIRLGLEPGRHMRAIMNRLYATNRINRGVDAHHCLIYRAN